MSAIVSAARSYKGVRFCHRGRSHRALDCAGLVWISYKDCGVTLGDFRLYSKEPSAHGASLTDYVSQALGSPVAVAPVKQGSLQVGDIVVMRFEREPHHMGIITDYPYGGLALIHACGHNNKVVEHRLSDDQVKRITHVFRRPL